MQQRINALLETLYHPDLRRIDPGLDRVEAFLERLGNPQRKLPPVVHVAGTNGKGSTIAYLQAMLEDAGYRVHRYISPHLVQFNERITVAGNRIEDAQLFELLQRVQAESAHCPVTFFEATTAAAFLAFCDVAADILLLETGMGGRLDATNVIARPALTVITPVSMDHSEFLGGSLAAIAVEKAGILKPGVACVVSGQAPEALYAIEEQAALKNAGMLLRCGQEWQVAEKNGELVYSGYSGYEEKAPQIFPLPVLPGGHQRMNAGAALTCAGALEGFRLTANNKSNGLLRAHWPGRLQRLEHAPWLNLLPAGSALWLDGGHNPAAGEMLAAWLKEQPQSHKILIAGMVNTKDSQGYFRPFCRVADEALTLSIPGEDTSQTAEALAVAAESAGLQAKPVSGIVRALEKIGQKHHAPVTVLVCGSLYLAGAVLKEIF